MRSTRINGNKTVSKSIASFDSWLDEQQNVVKKDSKHQNEHRNYVDKTMHTYIRNYIDHPGDCRDITGVNLREKPTAEEIKESIEFMVELTKID